MSRSGPRRIRWAVTIPNVLPGTADVAAPDDDDSGEGQGYLWNGALKAGLTLRNYGFFVDLARYNLPARAKKV